MDYEDDSSCSEGRYIPNQLKESNQESINATERRNVKHQKKAREKKQRELNKEEEKLEERKDEQKLKEKFFGKLRSMTLGEGGNPRKETEKKQNQRGIKHQIIWSMKLL